MGKRKQQKTKLFLEQDHFNFELYRQLYSHSFFEKILKKIGITDQHAKAEMVNAILAASGNYECLKKANQNYEPPTHHLKRLKEFLKSVKYISDKYSKLADDKAGLAYMGFSCNLADYLRNEAITDYDRNILKPFAELGKNKLVRFDVNSFKRQLEIMDICLTHAIKHGSFKNTAKDGSDLEQWTRNIYNSWKLYSPLEFSPGKWDREKQCYKNKSLKILYQIMQKLDSGIEMRQIANSMIKISKASKKQG